MEEIVKLQNYKLDPEKSGNGIYCESLVIKENDIISIKTDDRDDAALFIKGLATLSYPVHGFYRFCDSFLDFSDYRNLLDAKRYIGYIGNEATMLSNRTIKENMTLCRCFFDNSQKVGMDNLITELCDHYKITQELDKRPCDITNNKIHAAISLREIMKKPKLLLMENPEDYLGYDFVSFMDDIFKNLLINSAVVFFSGSRSVRNSFMKSEICISNGVVTGV